MTQEEVQKYLNSLKKVIDDTAAAEADKETSITTTAVEVFEALKAENPKMEERSVEESYQILDKDGNPTGEEGTSVYREVTYKGYKVRTSA